MSAADIDQLILYVCLLCVLSFPLGLYMAAVYEGRKTFMSRLIEPVENITYKVCTVKPNDEMDWKQYAIAMFAFNILGLLAVYVLQRLQPMLPFNPQSLAGVSPDSAFNTAVSFASNTNWQGYSGELTMSYLTQMLGLNVQNFVSAATGMATLIAFIRIYSPLHKFAGQFLG